MSKERPILFNSEMVRAILDGRKTQTRRVITAKAGCDYHGYEGWREYKDGLWQYKSTHGWGNPIKCPYGVVGGKLWVRETWCAGVEWDDEKPSEIDPLCGGNDILYLASGKKTEGYGKTRPNIFMPKWATRLWLEITGTRAERVREIDAEEAEKEGTRRPKRLCPDRHDEYILGRFQKLWDSINAKRGYGWDVNPWVWVVEFRKVKDGE